METFVRIWALKCTLSVLQGPSEWVLWSQNWPKLHAIWPFGTFCISSFHESYKWIWFLVALIYGDYWENMSHSMHFIVTVKGSDGPKIVLNYVKYNFWQFFSRFEQSIPNNEKIPLNFLKPFKKGVYLDRNLQNWNCYQVSSHELAGRSVVLLKNMVFPIHMCHEL